MRTDERPTLVQHWIVVTDEHGTEHLEARWVVEGGHQVPAQHAA